MTDLMVFSFAGSSEAKYSSTELNLEERFFATDVGRLFIKRVLARNDQRNRTKLLGRRERTNCDVISVRISERELHSFCVRVHVGLLLEPGDESAGPLQGHVEIVDAEEQEQPVARCRLAWAHQGWMLVRAPLVEAEQDASIRIQDLTKVVMARRRLGLAKERLVPFEAARNVAYADDRPCAFHRIFPVGVMVELTRYEFNSSFILVVPAPVDRVTVQQSILPNRDLPRDRRRPRYQR